MKTYKTVVHNPGIRESSQGNSRSKYSDYVRAECWQSAMNAANARIGQLNAVHSGWSIASVLWVHSGCR